MSFSKKLEIYNTTRNPAFCQGKMSGAEAPGKFARSNARGVTPGKMHKLVANCWQLFGRSAASLGDFLTDFCQGLLLVWLLAKCRSIILFIIAPIPFIEIIFAHRENWSISSLTKKNSALPHLHSSLGIIILTCYNFMCIFFDCLFTYFFSLI